MDQRSRFSKNTRIQNQSNHAQAQLNSCKTDMRVYASSAILVMILMLSACASGTETVTAPPDVQQSPPAEDSSTIDLPSPMLSEDELLAAINAEEDLLGVLTEVVFDYDDEPGVVFVRWNIASGVTNEKIIAGAKQDTVVILRTTYLSGLEFDEIWLSGWYTVTIDINANTSHDEMCFLKYERETIAQLHWDRVRSQFIWDITRWKGLHDLFK